MNFGDAKLTVSAMVIEDSRNMCGNLHPNSVSRVLFSGLITLQRYQRSLLGPRSSSAAKTSLKKFDGWSLKAASDSIEKTIEIKPEGLIRFKTYSRLICIESRSRSRTIRIQSGISELFLYILILRFCISLNKGWASTNSKCRAWFSTGKDQTWFLHFDPYSFPTLIHFHSDPFGFMTLS